MKKPSGAEWIGLIVASLGLLVVATGYWYMLSIDPETHRYGKNLVGFSLCGLMFSGYCYEMNVSDDECFRGDATLVLSLLGLILSFPLGIKGAYC